MEEMEKDGNIVPTYTLKNIKSNEKWDVICSWNNLQEMLTHDPEIIQVPCAPRFVSSNGDMFGKTPDGFKDLKRRMKSGSGRGNTVNV